jgi:hypothetical protein
MTQIETENKIVEYFKKYIQKEIKIEKEHSVDFIKIPFTYIDYSAPLTFSLDTIDIAIYSTKEKKVIAIEYPWRQKDKLIYNRIEL